MQYIPQSEPAFQAHLLHHHHHHASQPTNVKPFRHGKIRFFILFLLSMVLFGNQYAFNNPQALQDSIMTQLDINEPQYDMLYTLFAFPSIFSTFIIGFLIDVLGVRIGLVSLSLGITIFQLFVAFGGLFKSYPLMLIGRMMFGIASSSLITAQSSFISFWFVGKQIAFALGIGLTLPELGDALNSFLTPTIFQKTQSLGPPLFTSVGVCTVSLACAITAAIIDKIADNEDIKHNVKVIEAQAVETESQQIKCEDLKLLKISYWLIALISMFAIGVYVSFLDNANRLFQIRFCFTQKTAGRQTMLIYIFAIVFSSPLGLLVDKFGKRRYFTIFGMLFFCLSHLLFLLYPQCVQQEITEYFSGITWGLLLLGLGYCFYANCLYPMVPLVVRKKVTGTAFGIICMAESITLSFFPLIAGQLAEQGKTEELGYRYSELFYFTMSLLGMAFSFGLLFISKKDKTKLDRSSRQIQLKTERLHSQDTESIATQIERSRKGSVDIRGSVISYQSNNSKISDNENYQNLQLQLQPQL